MAADPAHPPTYAAPRMVISINPEAKVAFVPYADQELPKERQTTFWIRDLTLREMEALEDQEVSRTEILTSDGSRAVNIEPHYGRSRRLLLLAGLVGWEGFRDEDGNEVQFRTEAKPEVVLGRSCRPVLETLLERIPGEVRDEIAGVIRLRARYTVDDRKKLLSPLPSPSTETQDTTAKPV